MSAHEYYRIVVFWRIRAIGVNACRVEIGEGGQTQVGFLQRCGWVNRRTTAVNVTSVTCVRIADNTLLSRCRNATSCRAVRCCWSNRILPVEIFVGGSHQSACCHPKGWRRVR
jgi:hypothetical protein